MKIPNGVRKFISERTPLEDYFQFMRPDMTQQQMLGQMNVADRPGYQPPSQPTPTMAPTPQPTPQPQMQQPQQQGMSFPNLVSNQPPTDIASLIQAAAAEAGIPPDLLAALLYHESNYKTDVIGSPDSGNPDYGIAQINLKSHPDVTEQQAFDPSFAIPYAARLLANYTKGLGGNPSRGLAAYNVGQGGAGIEGPAPYGGGPKGQYYIDNVTRNLKPEYATQLGLITSPNYR